MLRTLTIAAMLAFCSTASYAQKARSGGQNLESQLRGKTICYDSGARATFGADGRYQYSGRDNYAGTWIVGPQQRGTLIVFDNGQRRSDGIRVLAGGRVRVTANLGRGQAFEGRFC